MRREAMPLPLSRQRRLSRKFPTNFGKVLGERLTDYTEHSWVDKDTKSSSWIFQIKFSNQNDNRGRKFVM